MLTRVLSAAPYVFLTCAFICDILLICGCMPYISGQTSALQSIYAVQIHVPEPAHDLLISSYALCADMGTELSCAMTGGTHPLDPLPALYGHQAIDRQPIDKALRLQKDVFYGTPILAASLFVFSLVCAIASYCLPTPCPGQMKTIAASLAALASIVMLVDGYSAKLVLSALEIANSGAEGSYVYDAGVSWIVLQWMAFGLGLLGAGLLAFNAGKPEGGETPADHELAAREPMLPEA
jgi:hypothetical protein